MHLSLEARLQRLSAWLRWGLLLFSAARLHAQIPLYGDTGAHDPSQLIKQDGTYYSFSTGPGVPIKSSTNLRDWAYQGAVFPGGAPPWVTNAVPGFDGSFWAPEIAYFNGKYHAYYSCSKWGTIDSAIGVATTPSLANPVWTDLGKVVQSDPASGAGTDYTKFNCIDPSILVDSSGRVWLAFGSYASGIIMREIDPATGKPLNSTTTLVANNNAGGGWGSTLEASYIYQRGDYYYLFVNSGTCCAGSDSTYNIRVGRSTSPTGPYLDKQGVKMTDGGGSVFLESTGRRIGPGHAGILGENGTYWFSYHYYDGNASGLATLGVDELKWGADDWPYLLGGWSAFYPFDIDARDHAGLYNGALQGGASIASDPARGKVLELSGASQYATFPFSVANARTFSAWVKWSGGAAWQRIFDFGAGTGAYMYLTPSSGSGKLRFAIANGAGELALESPSALPVGEWCHVAVTLDGSAAALYLNGVSVAKGSIATSPWELLARNIYLGKSQYASDPYFAGRIDSFRIFSRALSSAEVAAIANAPASLAHRYPFTEGAADTVGIANGKLMGNAITAGGAVNLDGSNGTYVNLPNAITGNLVSGSSAVTIESWVTFRSNSAWCRLFDFGNIWGASGADYMFFSPHSGWNAVTLGLSTTAGSPVAESLGTLDNQSGHIVCIVDPSSGYMATYFNGVKRSEFSGSVPALNKVIPSYSFLGRSLFAADPYLNASIDEFRVYDGRLTPQEIAANYAAGPDVLGREVYTWSGSANRLWDQASTNWNKGGSNAPWSGAAAANFAWVGSGTVTVAAEVRPQSVAFSAPGYTLISSNGAAISVNSLSGIVASADAVISAPLSGSSGGLNKGGARRLDLRAESAYSGDTTVSAGTLSLLNGGAIYAGGYSTAVLTVAAGAVLEIDRWGYGPAGAGYRVQSLGGLDYGPSHLVIDGGTLRMTGGAAGAPQNPAEAPYGPGFTIGARGATLEAAKPDDVWTVSYDSRGFGPIASGAGGTLTLSGTGHGIFDKVLPGSGGLVKSGTGTWTLTRPNTFTGPVSIDGGTLYANMANAATGRAFNRSAGLAVNSGGTLRASANALFGWGGTEEKTITVNAGGVLLADGGSVGDVGVGTVVLAGGTLASAAASPAWGSWRFDNAGDKLLVTENSTASAANVKFGSPGASVEVAPGKTLDFTGSITDASSGGKSYLNKEGGGLLVLSGSNAYTGATAVNGGTILVNGSISASALTVASGALIGGVGSTRDITVRSGGTLGPGRSGPGVLAVGNANLEGTFAVEIAAEGYADRLDVSGSLVLGGALTVAAPAGLRPGAVFQIISKMGAPGPLGTFEGKPQASQFAAGGNRWIIDYAGGDGNDVTLTVATSQQEWMWSNFGANWTNALVAGDASDPERDGLPNLLEYAMGSDPAATSAVPRIVRASGRLTLIFTRNPAATDTTLRVLGADSLAGPWTELACSAGGAPLAASVPGATVLESGNGPLRDVQVGDQYLAGDPEHPARFLRLQVER